MFIFIQARSGPQAGSGSLSSDRDESATDGSAPDSTMPPASPTAIQPATSERPSVSVNLEETERWLVELPAEDYPSALELLIAEDTPPDLRALIMDDLNARPDPLRLPSLAQLTALPDHPFHHDALALLESELGEDYGTNSIGWADAITAHLNAKRHPSLAISGDAE